MLSELPYRSLLRVNLSGFRQRVPLLICSATRVSRLRVLAGLGLELCNFSFAFLVPVHNPLRGFPTDLVMVVPGFLI